MSQKEKRSGPGEQHHGVPQRASGGRPEDLDEACEHQVAENVGHRHEAEFEHRSERCPMVEQQIGEHLRARQMIREILKRKHREPREHDDVRGSDQREGNEAPALKRVRIVSGDVCRACARVHGRCYQQVSGYATCRLICSTSATSHRPFLLQ